MVRLRPIVYGTYTRISLARKHSIHELISWCEITSEIILYAPEIKIDRTTFNQKYERVPTRPWRSYVISLVTTDLESGVINFLIAIVCLYHTNTEWVNRLSTSNLSGLLVMVTRKSIKFIYTWSKLDLKITMSQIGHSHENVGSKSVFT